MAGQTPQSAIILQPFDPDAEFEIRERNLPHWRQEGAIYFVTFRLGDALPHQVVLAIEEDRRAWRGRQPSPLSPEMRRAYQRLFSARIEECLHAGHGSCVLRQPAVAQVVEDALRYFHPERYLLGDYVIMPNHVHVLAAPKSGFDLSRILHSWKSFTANRINSLLGQTGRVWQDESYDHIVRDDDELTGYRQYIAENPCNAGISEGDYRLGGTGILPVPPNQ